jgi:predicted ArsR family transcriptional regulator
VRGERRRAIFARILAALSEPQSAVRLADHLDISVAVARRRLSQLRDAGAVSLGEDGKFVRVNSSAHRPPVSDDMSRGSFAKTPDRVSP